MTTSTNGTFDRTPLIAGNWKMNMDHVQGITLLQKLAWTLSDAKHDYSRVEVAVFPPFTDLRGVQTLVQGDELNIVYGGQDLSQFDSGAYTGDISGQFLDKLGCKYVLVGHSERRTIHGESDEVLNAKVKAAYRHNVTPVLCVGEGLEIRQAGTHVEHTLAQLRADVEGLTAEQAAELVVAYEPVWAIGTGEVAGPEDAQEMCAAIRAELANSSAPTWPARSACCTAVRSRPATLPPSSTNATSTACWWAVPAWMPPSLLILSGSRATC